MEEKELTVNGFRFSNAQEAEEAVQESRKIQYLETKIDYADLRKVQAIYEKAIRENVFHTSVGLFYLKGIRDFLVREDMRYEEVLPQVPASSGGVEGRRDKAEEEQREQIRQQLENRKQQLRFSIFLNVLLVLAVLAMFWITLNSEQPNILNYERALKDRYASWEQELSAREQTVRQKEREQLLREDSESKQQ